MKVQAESQRQLVARLRTMRASGRIVLELPAQQAQLKDLPDLTLEDGDRFAIPAAPSVVGVVGSVYNQNAFIYRSSPTTWRVPADRRKMPIPPRSTWLKLMAA